MDPEWLDSDVKGWHSVDSQLLPGANSGESGLAGVAHSTDVQLIQDVCPITGTLAATDLRHTRVNNAEASKVPPTT